MKHESPAHSDIAPAPLDLTEAWADVADGQLEDGVDAATWYGLRPEASSLGEAAVVFSNPVAFLSKYYGRLEPALKAKWDDVLTDASIVRTVAPVEGAVKRYAWNPDDSDLKILQVLVRDHRPGSETLIKPGERPQVARLMASSSRLLAESITSVPMEDEDIDYYATNVYVLKKLIKKIAEASV